MCRAAVMQVANVGVCGVATAGLPEANLAHAHANEIGPALVSQNAMVRSSKHDCLLRCSTHLHAAGIIFMTLVDSPVAYAW